MAVAIERVGDAVRDEDDDLTRLVIVGRLLRGARVFDHDLEVVRACVGGLVRDGDDHVWLWFSPHLVVVGGGDNFAETGG